MKRLLLGAALAAAVSAPPASAQQFSTSQQPYRTYGGGHCRVMTISRMNGNDEAACQHLRVSAGNTSLNFAYGVGSSAFVFITGKTPRYSPEFRAQVFDVVGIVTVLNGETEPAAARGVCEPTDHNGVVSDRWLSCAAQIELTGTWVTGIYRHTGSLMEGQ